MNKKRDLVENPYATCARAVASSGGSAEQTLHTPALQKGESADGTFCFSCNQPGNETCKEEKISCPKDSKCVTNSEALKINGTIQHSIHKGCAGDLPCGARLYNSVGGIYYGQNIECCSGNCCNAGKFNVPPEDSEAPNGRECPSCFQFSLEECNATEVRMCRGSRTKCFHYIGRARNPDGTETDYSMKTCISPELCDLGFGFGVGVHEVFHTVFNCT
ncbi:phospholipase A2 inhibitor 31 kDa subunit-like [Discoglossus pictus]